MPADFVDPGHLGQSWGSRLIPLINPAPRRQSGCRFGLGFVRGKLELVAGLQLAVGDATYAVAPVETEGPAGCAALVVVEDVNTFGQFACAGAGGQQQEAEGEAGH